jgi:hypothetical protein
MKSLTIPFLLAVTLLLSCENSEDNTGKGQLLFYTNSALINCPFEIEISMNGDKIGLVNGSTVFSDTNCDCDDPSGIGLLLDLKEGTYNYSAVEVECTAVNKINSWTGTIEITRDSCKVVFLDIFP